MAEGIAGAVLVVGSLNADLTVRTPRLPGPGETVTASDLVVSAGGKSSNQAAAAALLGADVRLLGRVGDDPNADLLLDRAQAAGVDTAYVKRLTDVATGSAMIAVDEAGENFILVSPGANGHLAVADVTSAPDFFAGGRVLCLCLEVELSVVAAAAEAAAATDVAVVLNLSPFQEVGEDLLRLVDVLVVNEHELAGLLGSESLGSGDEPDWSRVAQRLGALGPRHVVVTLGAAGAVVLSLEREGTGQVHAEPAPHVDAVDTTGGGDAFLGALASRLAHGEDPTLACHFAVWASAFAVTKPGTQASYPALADLDQFMASFGEDRLPDTKGMSASERQRGRAQSASANSKQQPTVVVVGGANLDVKAHSAARATAGTSNPGHSSLAPGGVGRNIAENLARLGTSTYLVSAVGRDIPGDDLLAKTAAAGVRLDYVHRTRHPTGTYTALLDVDGELLVAIADMTATADLGPDQVDHARDAVAAASLLVVDGNVSATTLGHVLDLAHDAGVRAIVEPVSVPKAAALAPYIQAERPLYAITPNRDELAALTGLPTESDDELRVAVEKLHERGVEHVWVRLGPGGSLLSSAGSGPATSDTVLIPAFPTTVVDVTGAGDSTLAAFCHALLDGKDPVAAARYGHAAASLTIASPETVRTDLTPQLIETVLDQSPQEERI